MTEPASGRGPAAVLAKWRLLPLFRGFDPRVTVVMTAAGILLLTFRKFGGAGVFEHALRPESLADDPHLTVYGDLYWFTACFVLLGLIPFVLSRPRRLRPPSVGLGPGDWRFGVKWVAILYGLMLPVVVIAAFTSTFSHYYPINAMLRNGMVGFLQGKVVHDRLLLLFVIYEIMYGVYFLGWEFFFRGYLLFNLEERFGFNAILIGNIPFVLMHVGKPFPEALGSVAGGLALGLFALRTRSVWYCFAIHVLVAWTMDAAALAVRAWG